MTLLLVLVDAEEPFSVDVRTFQLVLFAILGTIHHGIIVRKH
jgi:hypothetical protein